MAQGARGLGPDLGSPRPPCPFPRGSLCPRELPGSVCGSGSTEPRLGQRLFSVPAAGNAFCQAAQLHQQLQNKHDAATCFVDAGNAFKKADPQGEGPWPPGPAARAPAERSEETSSGFPGLRLLQWPTRDRLAGSPRALISELAPFPWHFHPAPSLLLPCYCVCSSSLPSRCPGAFGSGSYIADPPHAKGRGNLFCC